MKATAALALLLAAASVVGACTSPEPPSDQEAARETMVEFYSLLHNGEYQDAAELYGGSYEELTSKNPELDPADSPAQFRNGCTRNGFQCLEILDAEPADSAAADDFAFNVRFQNEDGTPFVLGPCCGATATEQPPVEVFRIVVHRTADGSFRVMTLPAYVP